MAYPPPHYDETRIQFADDSALGAGAPIVLFDFDGADAIEFVDRYQTIRVPAAETFARAHPLVPSFCPMQTIRIARGTECTIGFQRYGTEFVPQYERRYAIGSSGYRYFGGYLCAKSTTANGENR